LRKRNWVWISAAEQLSPDLNGICAAGYQKRDDENNQATSDQYP